MKQIVQNLKSGNTILEEVPVPKVKSGHVLIKTSRSLVSLGTEKMLVDFGKANYIQKARQQPEKLKEVINKIKTDGIRPTINAIFRKLSEPLPLGYCNAGIVIGVGHNVSNFKLGDRVVSNGHHAEVVNIPENLVAKIPNEVSFDQASFTIVGAIALQGIRLLKPTFGETVVVTGLGLIGLIAVQLLKANGCRVIGLDNDKKKISLAKSFGIESFNFENTDVVKLIKNLTNNNGADRVLITASTKSNQVISQSAQMCRQRGRIVLIGVIGLNINRSDFYNKEISFQVSCSYGPGRYDNNYEYKGMDYPIGFVRWTEKRNFEAFLNSIKNNDINVDLLITESVALDDYKSVYSDMSKKGSIASIFKYKNDFFELNRSVEIISKNYNESNGVIGIIGSGNFARSTLVPILNKIGAKIKYISSSNGLSSTTIAKKYKINQSVTDPQIIFDDKDVDGVIILTRHDKHFNYICDGLNSNKHVLVEKPLVIEKENLKTILDIYNKSKFSLNVGFNRRFSPFLIESKKFLNNNQPINVIANMNAGFIDDNHWVNDMDIGGGRIVGEACHYIDLITFLTGSLVESVVMNAKGKSPKVNTDTASILLKYKNGSQGVINYFSDGNNAYSKERIEIYDNGKNIIIDNFNKINFYGYSAKDFRKTQDKGHKNQFKLWIDLIANGGETLIPFDQILNTTNASFACIESLINRSWVDVK